MENNFEEPTFLGFYPTMLAQSAVMKLEAMSSVRVRRRPSVCPSVC